MAKQGKLITVAIHSYEKAVILKTLLEKEGIETVLHNVNLIQPVISSGVRIRIHEEDLPLALKIIESSSIMSPYQEGDLKGHSVMIPVDFSEYSLKACKVGFEFANANKSDVVLFHTYLDAQYSSMLHIESHAYHDEHDTVKSRAELERIAKNKMEDFKKVVSKNISEGKFPQADFTCIVTEGIPESEIINYSKELNPFVIVMGTRGKSKKETDLLGSVTAEVLDAGKFPVFTVPENLSINNIKDVKNVVFFSNLNQQDLLSFDIFSNMFNYDGLDVTIIPIVESKGQSVVESLEILLNYCKRHYPIYNFKSKYITDSDFIDDFDVFVKKENIDMIVIPNKKKNIFSRLFKPSIAHKMLFHSDTAMLVVPV